MAKVKIYTTPWCGYCHQAKALLTQQGVAFEEIDVDGDRATRAWLVECSGQRTVPQIFFGERSMGGYSELAALVAEGQLDALLKGQG